MYTDHQTQAGPATVTQNALPKGGGTIAGIGESFGAAGPDGAATMSIPLPVSGGRGAAPALSLVYSSLSGNSAFGLGWNLTLPSISRSTKFGVPAYDEDDLILGAGNEYLVLRSEENGISGERVNVGSFRGQPLPGLYKVRRYRTRIETFAIYERYTNQETGKDEFWIVFDPDGSVHIFGLDAKVFNPDQPGQIAVWHVKETIAVNGDHVLYRYRREDGEGLDLSGTEQNRSHKAALYLSRVDYGCDRGTASSFCLTGTEPEIWFFSFVLDYGERGIDALIPPPFEVPEDSAPLTRRDPFSSFKDGFEIRWHRLCRQALMFHRDPARPKDEPALVSRLLLDYAEDPFATTLIRARNVAYDENGLLFDTPPLELAYTTHDLTLGNPWTERPAFNAFDDGEYPEFVDLFGEGLPGILYKASNGWVYRAPIRDRALGGGAVAYAEPVLLPSAPVVGGDARQALMDISGNGRLDWVHISDSISGYFALDKFNNWKAFAPILSMPSELLHPSAHFTDMIGAGLVDLAMIGPRSIRIYPNARWDGKAGFSRAIETRLEVDGLPTFGPNQFSQLVAFADVLGSGNSHLVAVSHDKVTCWPNLGRGRFGKAITLAQLPYSLSEFDPSRVYLADLNGSGAADLIYMQSDGFDIYLNRSGNGFSEKIKLPSPPGVKLNDTCQIFAADIAGNGMASLVVIVPHMEIRHFLYEFWQEKPLLLKEMNNNLGRNTRLLYRHSAQEWLDEKSQNPAAICRLPITVPLLKGSVAKDEITDFTHENSVTYRGGVYDGAEREFRGFRMLESKDIELNEEQSSLSTPSITRTWFHTGAKDDVSDRTGYFAGDEAAIILAGPRITRWDGTKDVDVDFDKLEDRVQKSILYAMKGQVLRSELFGADQPDVPYSATENRVMVRIVDPAQRYPVVIPFALEGITYNYERIIADPQCAHQIGIEWDAYGTQLVAAQASYPRRTKPSENPYPASVLDSIWDNSYDDQQDVMRLGEVRASVHHIDGQLEDGYWRLGLPKATRSNVLNWEGSGSLSYEALSGTFETIPRQLVSQSAVYYDQDDLDAAPDFFAIPHHSEVAVLDEDSLVAYDGKFDDTEQLETFLIELGYLKRRSLLSVKPADAQDVWVAPGGFDSYRGLEQFLCVHKTRPTLLYEGAEIGYDDHYLAVVSTTDPLGNVTRAEFNYRLMAPWRQTDINDNCSEVLFDPLGRVIASSFYGSENNEAVGFAPVADYRPMAPGLDEAVSDPPALVQAAAAATVYGPFAWMGSLARDDVEDAVWNDLVARGYILPRGQICAMGRTRIRNDDAIPETVKQLIVNAPRKPPYTAGFVANAYAQSEQRVAIAITYTDGFGRLLQSKALVGRGEAYKTENDSLLVDENDQPVIEETTTRWATSARVEYNEKGEAYRAYRPFSTDTHRFVDTASMRKYGHFDTMHFDALGRTVRAIDAKGHVSRQATYPWFSISEDANDTGLVEPPVRPSREGA